MIDFKAAADEIGISPEAYKRLCALFLETMKEDTEKLVQAVSSGSRDEIHGSAHHIKGAAANLDFELLSARAEEIQHGAREQDMSVLKQKVDQLLAEYRSVKSEIEEIL